MTLILAVVLLSGMAEPSASPTPPREYLIVFSCRNHSFQRMASHVFGVVVKETPGPMGSTWESICISWIWQDDNCPKWGDSQPGRNMSLEESLERACCKSPRICRWGPFAVQDGLFDQAAAWKTCLEQNYRWRMLDHTDRFAGRAMNCVHALADVDQSRGRLLTGLHHGQNGAKRIVRHLSHWYVQPTQTHDEVLTVLGLDANRFLNCSQEWK